MYYIVIANDDFYDVLYNNVVRHITALNAKEVELARKYK